MSGNNDKRKDPPTAKRDQQGFKKRKTGNKGKWKTPHQQAKVLHQDATLQPGDTGVWVTCARNQEGKAAREIGVLFSEYAEKMYGIKSVHDTAGAASGGGGREDGDDDAEDDLEAAIQKEVAALASKPSADDLSPSGGDNANNMRAVKMNVACLLFVKTFPPVDPVAFVRRICEDARKCDEIPGLMRCRYVNRLTPVSVMGKATETGLVEVAREVLGKWFDLKEKVPPATDDQRPSGEAQAEPPAAPPSKNGGSDAPYTFAIRPTIRNHSKLKRDVVIHTVAGLINDDRHKVNLGSPDKVILVDIHQTVCGMSVIDGDWEELKRYNLRELYGQAREASTTNKDESSVTV